MAFECAGTRTGRNAETSQNLAHVGLKWIEFDIDSNYPRPSAAPAPKLISISSDQTLVLASRLFVGWSDPKRSSSPCPCPSQGQLPYSCQPCPQMLLALASPCPEQLLYSSLKVVYKDLSWCLCSKGSQSSPHHCCEYLDQGFTNLSLCLLTPPPWLFF